MTDEDELSFNLKSGKVPPDLYNDGTRVPNKREFLRVIMSVYDPLGVLIPFTTHSRVIMQGIWKSEIDWGEELLEKEFKRWREWLSGLNLAESCKIAHCYIFENSSVNSIELHVFSDASSKAYATVAYWCFLFKDQRIHTSFIMARSHVAPASNELTIPRLELQGAVLSVRLAETILSEHEFAVSRKRFRTDSKTVLQWIGNRSKIFKTFVSTRLGEIHEKSDTSE